MEEIICKTKKWGNSIGITIPNKTIKQLDIKPEQELTILIEKPKTTKVKDIFGKLKFKESTEKIMEEIDKDLDIAF